jgi:uridine kinase
MRSELSQWETTLPQDSFYRQCAGEQIPEQTNVQQLCPEAIDYIMRKRCDALAFSYQIDRSFGVHRDSSLSLLFRHSEVIIMVNAEQR